MPQDELTKLPDRNIFLEILSKQVSNANIYKSKVGLLIVDIGRFHRINNLFGYRVGDQVLQKFAELLKSVIRQQDYVARIGDNRFALILTDIMNVGHAELAAHKILRLLQVPFSVNKDKIYIDCTVAISLCPTHASNYLYLMKECESVLHETKQGNKKIGKSAIPEDEEISETWDIEVALDSALEQDQFLIHYQPKISLITGNVVGVEALLRWNHPLRGYISPNYFIPIAERMGNIKLITNWILNTVLRQSSEWTNKWGTLSVSVNIPPDLILSPDLKDHISNALNLWGSENITLTLEIIERSLVMEPDRSFVLLKELQEMGVSISIDDFGTGYSSLSYFEQLPVNELKIDQSFIANVVENSFSQNIVKLIVDLAHACNMEVVAEGVENIGALRYLKKINCDIAQGYYIAKPMPFEKMTEWLAKYPGININKL
ncbi:diguanylate cyclase/phosphodiesterase (GGDEF & EAL domains) with PAS/PAC sensor(s) [hydrothermal vent metagenome]|uniref:Diguanylate cyclase/phosphodiesterase (GGDEF & EAL domains) with PAS/PAC sensor(S) n=1 Tax=hydrothermal vent metagenome TaxID=652676 RepID=A0A3B1BHG5_9ZZZZ